MWTAALARVLPDNWRLGVPADVKVVPGTALFGAMRPVFYVYWVLGCFPFKVKHSRLVPCFSTRTLREDSSLWLGAAYTIVAYVAVVCLGVGNLILDTAKIPVVHDRPSTFTTMVVHCGLVLETLAATATPVRYWLFSGRLREYFAAWRRLEEDYKAVTGETLLPLGRKRVAVGLCLVGPACAFVFLFVTSTWYVYLMSVTNCLRVFVDVLTWCALCSAVASSADQLLACARRDLAAPACRRRGPCAPDDYCKLWLQLSDVGAGTGDFLFLNFAVEFVRSTIRAVTDTYKLFTVGSSLDGAHAATNMAILFFTITAAHNASEKLNSNFKAQLLVLQSEIKDEGHRKQILRFVQVVSHGASKISLDGLLTFDRSLATSMMNVFLTYLVIMLQLQGQFSTTTPTRNVTTDTT